MTEVGGKVRVLYRNIQPQIQDSERQSYCRIGQRGVLQFSHGNQMNCTGLFGYACNG